MLTVADIDLNAITELLSRFGLSARRVSADAPIEGTFWGEPEAGIVGTQVFIRGDTPVHSLLHETCHIICMDSSRRDSLDRDAGGDDLEESAVCYLQVLLADELPGVGRRRLMQDMDDWGYSFRLGSTAAWFDDDAADAASWLQEHGLVSASGDPVYRLRSR